MPISLDVLPIETLLQNEKRLATFKQSLRKYGKLTFLQIAYVNELDQT